MSHESIFIYNGKIWNGNKFIEGNVLVKNGVVDYIGNGYPKSDYVYDAKGCIVSPGLIDSHIHIRGLSSDVYATSAEMSCFPFGVTTAADAGTMYINTEILDSLSLNTLVFVVVNIQDNIPDFENTKRILDQYGERVAGVKVFFDKEADVSDICSLEKICDFALGNNLKVLVHSTGTPVPMFQLLSLLKSGDICTHIYHGGKHSALDDDFVSLKEARNRGVILDAGMAGGVHTDFSILKKAIDNNVLPDVISSDITSFSAFTRGGRYGLTMCMSIMRTLGMDENEILRAVTSSPAKVFGKESVCGTLSEGCVADISVLSYADEKIELDDRWGHSFSAEKSYRCKLTICGGNVVYKD